MLSDSPISITASPVSIRIASSIRAVISLFIISWIIARMHLKKDMDRFDYRGRR